MRHLVLLLIWAWTASAALAQPPEEPTAAVDAKPGLPTITSHSQTSFAVRKGDKFTVEVQAQGEGLTYKWLRRDDTLCREAVCEFDTAEWGLGSHKLTLVVFNPQGSLFVKFNVRVLTVPAGYQPAKVRAPLVESSEAVETVSVEDLAVATTSGRGFSYDGKKVLVVGPTLRALDWTEKLRTQSVSTLRFGRQFQEEHLLGERSSVQLVKSETERRLIVLRHGVVRSRQLGDAPRWSIVVEPWLQIDTDAQGDVLVERSRPKPPKVELKGADEEVGEADYGKEVEDEQPAPDDVVTVTVLRGTARVYRWTDDAGRVGNAITVPQGLELRLTRATLATPPLLTQPDAKRVQRLFAQTTPHYLPGGSPAKWGDAWTLLGSAKDGAATPTTLGAAVGEARQAVTGRDFMTALELLAPFAAEMKTDYDALLAYGEAAVGLSLLDTATAALNDAAELEPKRATPKFLLGYIALAGSRWQEALDYLEDAEDLDYPDAQALSYYLGVARFQLHKRLGARDAFTYSLWETGVPAMTTSARDFLRRVQDDGWLAVRLGAGVFQDSNVLGSDSVDVTTLGDGGLKAKGSLGYAGNAGFTAYAFRNAAGNVRAGFDISQHAYLDASLTPLTRLDQQLDFGFGFALGGAGVDTPALVAFDLGLYAATVALGDERSMDSVGSVVQLGSPRLWGATLRLASAMHLDPVPDRDDILDPVSGDLVSFGDRSSREILYGLNIKPIAGERWSLGVDVASISVTMANDYFTTDNYKDLDLDLDLGFAPSLRQRFSLAIARHARTYAQSEDSRKDSRLELGLGWRWHYTPALYQVLDLRSETQSSNRDVSAYRRQVYGLSLGLDF